MGGGGGGGSGGGGYYDKNKSIDEKEREASEKLSKQAKINEPDDNKITVFISHQNRDEEKTQRAHQYADYIKENSEFNVEIDKDFFPEEKLTNIAKINEIISEAMRESDIFVALYHPVKESNRYERSAWYNLEAQKARYWGKPMIHVFLDGARDSGVIESSKCYKIYYQKGEHWRQDLLEKINTIAQEHEIKD